MESVFLINIKKTEQKFISNSFKKQIIFTFSERFGCIPLTFWGSSSVGEHMFVWSCKRFWQCETEDHGGRVRFPGAPFYRS